MTLQNTKKVENKYRWFFDIRNQGTKPFEGSVEIKLKNAKGNTLAFEEFSTKQPIQPGLGTVVYLDSNTGPPEVHGDYGITGFDYDVKPK